MPTRLPLNKMPQPNSQAVADGLIACMIAAWFSMNRYTITIDQKAVTVSTALWRMRGLPDFRSSRCQRISVTGSQVF